jgi:hypothetical protein
MYLLFHGLLRVMASKFSGSNFLELATEFDIWQFFWHQHFWSQSKGYKPA